MPLLTTIMLKCMNLFVLVKRKVWEVFLICTTDLLDDNNTDTSFNAVFLKFGVVFFCAINSL